jgi:hypothetical protein
MAAPPLIAAVEEDTPVRGALERPRRLEGCRTAECASAEDLCTLGSSRTRSVCSSTSGCRGGAVWSARGSWPRPTAQCRASSWRGVRVVDLLCSRRTLLLDYSSPGHSPQLTAQIVEVALHASGMRDTARVLHAIPTTVIHF